MGSTSTKSSSLILSTRQLLIISAAVAIAVAVAVKLCTPPASSSLSGIPAIWSAITSWLKPPYLYIVINCIIITIVASSRLHVAPSEPSAECASPTPPPPAQTYVFAFPPPEMAVMSSDGGGEESTAEIGGDEAEEIMDKTVVVVEGGALKKEEGEPTLSCDDAPPSPEVISSPLMVREKPLISTRFGQRRPTRTSLHEALGVARTKKQETLESTWKMVTDGRHVPLTRHLKTRSERWEHHVSPEIDHVPKSETFKERAPAAGGNYSGGGVNRVDGKIRREPSLGQDELNRRVEAFIKKFNEEMRIQRQESLNRFMEMINRGV